MAVKPYVASSARGLDRQENRHASYRHSFGSSKSLRSIPNLVGAFRNHRLPGTYISQVRISTGTRDEAEARQQLADLQAKLQLGLENKPKPRIVIGPQTPWQDFRDRYYDLQLTSLRDKSRVDAESRLDIAERILKPKRLADVADREALHELQSKLLAGVESRYDPPRPRSAHTVRSHMASVIAALGWAELMGWLPAVPRIRKVKVSKLRHMKGRPITVGEFKAMISATEEIVGKAAAPSWRYVLRGLWESGLRIGELMSVHWTDARYIVPRRDAGEHAVLAIPADMQKNATEEAIPLLPGFANLLLQTPAEQRDGWAFNPLSLQGKAGRKLSRGRLNAEWVGKVISKIGEEAGIVVQDADGDKPAKYASAHDLRRSCADNLIAAGVSEREVAAEMRHASVETTRRHYAPGNVQRSAKTIRQSLLTA